MLDTLCPFRCFPSSFPQHYAWRVWSLNSLTRISCLVAFSCKGNGIWGCWWKGKPSCASPGFLLPWPHFVSGHLLLSWAKATCGIPIPQLQVLPGLSHHSLPLCLQSLTQRLFKSFQSALFKSALSFKIAPSRNSLWSSIRGSHFHLSRILTSRTPKAMLFSLG